MATGRSSHVPNGHWRTGRLGSRLDGVPEPGTIALDLTCAECGRSPRAGETWRILFADIGEAVTYCLDCAEREFGESD